MSLSKSILFCIFLLHLVAVTQAQNSFYLNHGGYKLCRFSSDAIYFLNNNSVLDKTDYSGNIIWSKKIPISSYQLLEVRENTIYITSGFNLMRLDTSGNVIWGRDLSAQPCSTSFYIANMISDKNHIFVVTRNSGWGNGGLITFDTSGTIVNSYCDNTAIINAILFQGFERLTGGVWFRFFDTGTGASDAWLTRADSLGNIDNSVNSIGLNFGVYDNILDVIPLPDSSYVVLNSTSTNSGFEPGGYKIALSRFKDDGTVLWQKEFHSLTAMLTVYSGGVDSSANIYFFGEMNYDSLFTTFILKIDSSGNLLLAKEWRYQPITFNGLSYSRMGYHNQVLYSPFRLQGFGAGMLLLDSMLTPPCGIQEITNTLFESAIPIDTLTWTNYLPSTYFEVDTIPIIQINPLPTANDICLILSDNDFSQRDIFNLSPNPSHDFIRINSRTIAAKIEIFNSLGNLFLKKSVSSFPETVDVRDLPPGIYFLKLQAETETAVRKIIVD